MKSKISITIERKLAENIDIQYRELVKVMINKNMVIPKLSNIYEEIIRYGFIVYNKKMKSDNIYA